MKFRKRMVVGLAAIVLPFFGWCEAISYSDGQTHEFAAEAGGSHVDSIDLSNGSKLVLTGGDLYVDQSKVVAIGSCSITVKRGARLLCPTAVGNYNGFKFYNYSKLIVDGGYVRAPASSAKNSTVGAVIFSEEYTYRTPAYLEIHNGGTFEIDATSGGVASMFMGCGGSMLIDGGSTFKLTPNNAWGAEDRSYCLQIADTTYGSFAVTNSTFTFFKWAFGGVESNAQNAQNNTVSFHNSKVSGSSNANKAIRFYGKESYHCRENVMRFSGENSEAKVSVETAGLAHDNTVYLEGGTFTGDLALSGGHHNKFVQTGGTYGNGVITLGSQTNEVKILGGELACTATDQQKSLIFNASAVGCNVVFSNCTATFKSDGNAVVTWVPVMAFTEGARDSSVVVQDAATVDIYGYNQLNTTCEGCAFQFYGATPHLRVKHHWITQTYQLELGVDDTTKVGKTVALKYVLPAEPYAVAPLDGSGTMKPIKIGTSTKIVVETGDWVIGTDKKKTFYPLVSDNGGFGDLMTAERVATLNANAVLPEGAQLEYDATAKTLGVRMPRKKLGLFLVVK